MLGARTMDKLLHIFFQSACMLLFLIVCGIPVQLIVYMLTGVNIGGFESSLIASMLIETYISYIGRTGNGP